MPFFQDDVDRGRQTPPEKLPIPTPDLPLLDTEMRRQPSEESIRTDLCEGPLLESPSRSAESPPGCIDGFVFPLHGTSDRVELIQRLKRGEDPTWLPNRNLESLLHDYEKQSTAHRGPADASQSSPLLPPAEFSDTKRSSTSDADRIQAGLEIERPRSALHSGDFTEPAGRNDLKSLHSTRGFFTSEPQPWLSTSPPRDYNPFQVGSTYPSEGPITADPGIRFRAPSLSSSYSSSFVYKPPTSPLVQSESNEDLELSSFMNPIDITSSSHRNPRRHTLNISSSIQSTPSVPGSSASYRPQSHFRRDVTYPYQAHQPRRSLTLTMNSPLPSPSPQTPASLRSRRPSFTLESSPLHASMVGSYEESILRGRMSTTPSKPLDFLAQIGVLGLGKCKANLKCPPHVTIPFPAVFYSYETTSHGRSGKPEDGPSPYVGQIDLENGLPNPNEGRESNRKRRNISLDHHTSEDLDMGNTPSRTQPSERELRRAEKQKRRSTSPRAPPGGCYRIPEIGQLQIIIKNPNKTAVKLFLVPYDLSGMEPGTKTFIRQRSYSAGPIIDSAISSTPQTLSSSPFDRPTLRYLVHLHICCPSRGRYYLYKSIRVVFANRVPDGKEKLKNEITLPEPRFTVYKPSRESGIGLGVGASLAAEKAYRRRSYGYHLTSSHRTVDAMDGIRQALEKSFGGGGFANGVRSGNHPVEALPFSLSRQHTPDEDGYRQQADSQILSPASSKSSRPATSQGPDIPLSWDSCSSGITGYDKLHKGDIGYGGNAFSGSPDGKQGVAESLLARKLKGLGVGFTSPQDRLNDI